MNAAASTVSSDPLNVLLVAPTALDAEGRPIRQRRLYLPALTLPVLAAVTPPPHRVRLVYEGVEDVPVDEPWDIVGLTGMGSGLVRAWEIADEFRARGVPVVIGGIAASLLGPEQSLEHADAVVVGEAERTWPRLLEDLRAGRLREVYRSEEQTPPEAWPVPRYDLLPRRRLGLWRPVQATRGCPFTCDYCSITAYFSGSYRARSVDAVIRDIREARKGGSRYIAFIDDNIGVNWTWFAELMEALVWEDITWMSQCSLHIADRPEMLELARKSGCCLLSVGIESTSQESLGAHGKPWNRSARYREAIEAIRGHGIDVSTEMMVGMDGDDESVFDRTYAFLMDNQISVPRVHIMTPVPGTPLFGRMRDSGRLLNTDFARYTGGEANFRPSGIEPSTLKARYWGLYERLFTLPAIFHRTRRNHARLGPFMRAFVIGVNFHYRGHIRRRITPGIV